ncbi:MAG: hypothetical protein P8Z40_13925 [Chloroflexota bacterium]|jgi:hypothetical protein
MSWQRLAPIVISITVIILIAILQEHSRLVAAITATMPLTAPLGIWIVYAAQAGDQKAIAEFNGSLLVGVWPTVGFLVAVWLAARTGWRLVPMLAAGYAAWVVGLGVLFGVRYLLEL